MHSLLTGAPEHRSARSLTQRRTMDKSDRIALWVIDGLLWLALVLMCIALTAIGNITS